MEEIQRIKSIAREVQPLERRISQNQAAQEIDLVEWIADRVRIIPGSLVLELCSGTGSQTLRLLELTGCNGRLLALDISGPALEKLSLKGKDCPNLTMIQSDMDDLNGALREHGLLPPAFDLVFCAYGLYYSKDARQVLGEAKQWLKKDGRIAVVGPFGPNNQPLFSLLEENGVVISDYVTYTSRRFMHEEVIPWAARNFHQVRIDTLVNRIQWRRPEEILSYWKSSTFFDPCRLGAVESGVQGYFSTPLHFINEKWIMFVEMSHAR